MSRTLILSNSDLLVNDVGEGLRITDITQPEYGVIVWNGHAMTYTAPLNPPAIAAGEPLSFADTFSYEVKDKYSRTAQATVTITVILPEDDPGEIVFEVVNDVFACRCGQSVTIPYADLLENDTGTGLTVTSFGTPVLGTLAETDDGTGLIYDAPACDGQWLPDYPTLIGYSQSSNQDIPVFANPNYPTKVGDLAVLYFESDYPLTHPGWMNPTIETGWTEIRTEKTGRRFVGLWQRVIDAAYLQAWNTDQANTNGFRNILTDTRPKDGNGNSDFDVYVYQWLTVFGRPETLSGPLVQRIALQTDEGSSVSTAFPSLTANAAVWTMVNALPFAGGETPGATASPEELADAKPFQGSMTPARRHGVAFSRPLANYAYPHHAMITWAGSVSAYSVVMNAGPATFDDSSSPDRDSFTYTVTSNGATQTGTVTIEILPSE